MRVKDQEMRTLLFISAAIICDAVSIISLRGPAPVDNHALTACAGANVSFNWSVDVVPGGHVIAVTWLFESPGKKNITLASLVNDRFYPRLDNSHVTFVPNAGLRLSNVSSEHSGRYYVIAQFQSKGGHGVTSFQNGASLFVSDAEPVIRDRQLRVTLGYNGIKDNNDQTWTAGLYCGQFVSRVRSPVEATWTTPSGRTVKGDFDETTASFILPLAEDVESGTYVCHLKMVSNATGCLVSTTTAEAQIQVDGRDVRVMILEMQLRELREKYNKIMTLPISSQQNHIILSHEKSSTADFYRLVAKKSEEEQQHGRRKGNTVSLNIHHNIHLPDDTLEDLEKEVASKNAQQDREMNETVSKMEDLERELEEIIAKNMQENRKLEQILARNTQQDIEMKETASKTEELEREQDALIAKNVQQVRQLEQVVAKMESNTNRLDMLVQTQMRALEANAHNTSQQLLSLKAEHDDIKKLINKTTATPICLREWTLFNEHIYKYVQENISWSDAKARCEAEQSWLVEINSELENEFLLNLTNRRDAWIGLSDAALEGTFVWIASNKRLSENVYTNWANDQPDNYLNNEDCVHLRSSGEWNDSVCPHKHSGFVCERSRYSYRTQC